MTDENGEVQEIDKENYAYGPGGRLAETQNAHSRHQYFYDKLGNLIREYRHDSLDGTARSHVWHHRYDALGNRTETIRPDGQRIGYLHYGSGHLHGITLNHNEIAAFERDKLHRETERTFGKHIRQETQYDPMGRILQQIHNRSRREYGYDAAGQLTHIQSRGGQTQYRYDPIGRLIAAVTPDFSETFAFDPADNRLDLSGNKQDHTGQTNSQEKPSLNKVWGNLLKEYAGVHYDYDQRGNLIRKTRNGETTDYHWNGYNQLVKIENRNGSTEYRYDPLGRRTAKIRNGETTVYHWQEDTLAIESTNGQNTHYLFEPDTFEPLAQFQTTSPIGIEREDKPAEPYSYDPETDPLLKIPPEPQEQSEVRPELVYYQLDHLGTPITAHNAKGEAIWTAEYEAWGRIRNETVSDGLKVNVPFRFQGQYYDEESGLHYNRFRYYDPQIGRFISQDPIGLMGGINLFEYAPNTTRWIDPLGLNKKTKQNKSSQTNKNQNDGCNTPSLVDVYHYTDEKAYKAIISQRPNYLFKASQPDSVHAKGVYVTPMSPSQILHKPGGFKSYLGITKEKSQYYFKFKVEKCKLKKIKGMRGNHVWFSPTNLLVTQHQMLEHGKTAK